MIKDKKFEWWIIGLLGFVSFVLAFIGFRIYFVQNGIERNFLDLIFHSIKIFGMELVDEYVSPLPLPLEIARWLAPGVLVYTAFKGVMYLVGRELKVMMIRSYKNHIIVSGINYRSLFLIYDILKKEKVVVLTKDMSETGREMLERKGAVVISGEPGDPAVLKSVAAARVKYFVFLDEDDEKNISHAISTYDHLKSTCSKTRPVIYTHVSSYTKLNELKEINFFDNLQKEANTSLNYDIRIFSDNERTARVLTNKFAPDSMKVVSKASTSPIKIGIFGSGELTKSLVNYLAALGHYANYKNIDLTLFTESQLILKELKHYTPQIEKVLNINTTVVDFNIFDTDHFQKNHAKQPFDVVYLTCVDDEISLKIMNRLSKIKFKNPIDVVLSLINPQGILNKWYDAEEIGNMKLHKFNITEETFTQEAIISGKLDLLAKEIHNDYLANVKANGKYDPSKETHKEWEYLSEEIKNQNRLQADHIWVKLRAIGCSVVPLDEDDVTEHDITKDKKAVEKLAKMEHNRWMAQMLLNDWKHGKKRDDKNKIHPDLIPYEKLSEDIKQYDRDAVINIPNLLAELDMKIIKSMQG